MNDQCVVFIRGTGRCGSKNLVTHLGHHPALAHVPVNQILPEELIDWSSQRLQVSHPNVTDQAVADACRAYFTAYGRSLAGKQGILLQKSTRHAHHLSTLLEIWPQAKIVYMVRHPIGVVEAFINGAAHDRSDGRPDYGYRAGVADSLLQWYTEIIEYLDSSAFGHARVLQVQFERLIADPRETTRDILRFLELQETDLPPYGEPELYDDPFVLNQRERGWIIEQTAPVLARLGYDPSAWSAEVPGQSVRFLENWSQCRLQGKPDSLDVARLTMMAIQAATENGHRRIGLFGAGYLTGRACGRLGPPPCELVCIFDDNPSLHGSIIAGIPVRSPESAAELGVEAVVAMTFVHQKQMMGRWRQWWGDAIPIAPLWDDEKYEASKASVVLSASH